MVLLTQSGYVAHQATFSFEKTIRLAETVREKEKSPLNQKFDSAGLCCVAVFFDCYKV
jgi:hypothetical protein